MIVGMHSILYVATALYDGMVLLLVGCVCLSVCVGCLSVGWAICFLTYFLFLFSFSFIGMKC